MPPFLFWISKESRQNPFHREGFLSKQKKKHTYVQFFGFFFLPSQYPYPILLFCPPLIVKW